MKPIPYGRQYIDQDDIDQVVNALTSDFLTQGPKIKEFEDNFAKYVDAKYAVAVNNATSGLHLAVLALGLEPGDRIITTPITFAATGNCARFVGAEVWFADIDPDSYLISVESVKKLIESKPKGFFKGIIPVDFAGLPINSEEFRELANEHDLWIIEDACHAPGGWFKDSNDNKIKCGNTEYSDIAIFSFHPVKHIACGEGGMITTSSKEIYDKLKILRTHGIAKDNMLENHGDWYYEMQELGYNYRITDIQAALGISQLAKNSKGLERRNQIAKKYQSAFEGKVKYQHTAENFYNAYHLFVIEVVNRKELYEYLRANLILAQIHYIPMHYLPYYKKLDYSDAGLHHSENYYTKCISLPMFPSLSEQEQEYVIEKVLTFIYG